ncbi:response regulator [Winogradskyella sp. 3972H.M.0a.05]|uniref:LytR/AlgR family response regulator transcription factor n=1 Tax=Winogradskyella sp. 3972H.M.0a.05 TaxID=2950277 RepID=UPI003392EB5C
MRLRYIIVDDEYLARQRLLKLLKPYDNMVMVGECRNGKEALDVIPIKEPDLVFLDIQMPDYNGFEVLSELRVKPYVIFTTAYDAYALKAFEINAVDYLLKPFDEDRLQTSLSRIFELKQQQSASDLEHKIKALIRNYQSNEEAYKVEFSIKERGRLTTIYVDDITYLKSDGNYVKLYTASKTFLYRSTLNTLHETLDPSQFLRIHRSIILNKFYIKQCHYLSNNEYKFLLKDGTVLESSRTYKSIIGAYLNEQ